MVTNTIKSRPLLVIFLGMLFLVTACSAPIGSLEVPASDEILQSANRYERAYVLQPGDQVEVFVYQHPEFSRTGTIRPDGKLTVPVLDEITASGLTPAQLDEVITTEFSARVRDPEVTVFVDNIEEPMVYLQGHVGNATAVPLRRARNLAQALTLGAGVTQTGSIRNVAIIRLHEDGYLRATPLVQEGRGQAALYLAMRNMTLEAGDLIFVPESNRSRFVRALQDFVNTPLGSLNQILSPYFQIRLLEEITDD